MNDDDHDDDQADERPLGDWCRANGWEEFQDCPDCEGGGEPGCLTCDGDGIIER